MDDADCPGGMSCDVDFATGERPVRDDSDTSCTPPSAKHCRWFAPSINEQALISGFAVRTMDLRVTLEPRLGLAWINPPGAEFVACAVFTCNPAIRKRDRTDNESDEPATKDTQLLRIANAEACVLQLQVADTSRSSLPITGTLWHPRDLPCSAETTSRRVVDFLAAGCWAYDSNQLIAATELLPIAAADLARITSAIPHDATCAEDNDDCFDTMNGFFGACVSGRCQPRCGFAQDCELAAQRLFGQPAGAPCSWQCRPVPESLAGVCVPVTG